MEDARHEGKRWFCSPSCLLQATSTPLTGRKRRKARGPVSALRRLVKWTLIVVALLLTVGIVGAIVGVGKTTKKAASAPSLVAQPSGPGSRSTPIPLGTPGGIGSGW